MYLIYLCTEDYDAEDRVRSRVDHFATEFAFSTFYENFRTGRKFFFLKAHHFVFCRFSCSYFCYLIQFRSDRY